MTRLSFFLEKSGHEKNVSQISPTMILKSNKFSLIFSIKLNSIHKKVQA